MNKLSVESAGQESSNFETIRAARCFDNARGFGKEVFTQDLTFVGNDQYVDGSGNVYELAMKKHEGDPDQYVLAKRAAN